MNTPEKPTPIAYNFDAIPAYFRERTQWMLWRYEQDGRRWTKVPYQTTGALASSTDAATWTTFAAARAVAEMPGSPADGIGYALEPGEDVVGIDIDHCLAANLLNDVAQTVLHNIRSYAERSVSGRGVHVYAFGIKPGTACRNVTAGFEMYSHARFLTFTGQRVDGAPATVERQQSGIDAMYHRYLSKPEREATSAERISPTMDDANVLAHCRRAKNGEKFTALYDRGESEHTDESSADFALIGMLRYFTQDPEQLERLMRGSKLVRPKWDTARPGGTYLSYSVANALSGDFEVYPGRAATVSASDPATWERFDAAAWSSWAAPAPEFVVEGLLPRRGVMWVGGRAKQGKSLFLLYLCLAILCGRPLVADKFPILSRPKILYVAKEDSATRLQERIRDVLSVWGTPELPAGALQFVIRPRSFNLGTPEHLEWVRQECEAGGYVGVVVDTWTASSPAHDPLGAKEQHLLAQAVVGLAQDIDGFVIVVDHTRKNRPEGGGSAGGALTSADIYGPAQKWQAAETILMLGDTGDRSRLIASLESKDLDDARFFLDVSPRKSEREKFSYGGSVTALTTAAQNKGGKNRQQIAGVLRAVSKSFTGDEVVAAVRAVRNGQGLSRTTVYGHLNALVATGEAVIDAEGGYRAIGA